MELSLSNYVNLFIEGYKNWNNPPTAIFKIEQPEEVTDAFSDGLFERFKRDKRINKYASL